MDDELQHLQEKLHQVSIAISHFVPTAEQASVVCEEMRQLLSVLENRNNAIKPQ